MTPVQIEPGQWAVAFDEMFMNPEEDMVRAVEGLQTVGGGWDWVSEQELMVVVQAVTVKPKTYWDAEGVRRRRGAVIAAFADRRDAIALRKRLFAAGKAASERIDAEVAKLAAPIRRRERAKALAEIRSAVPHLFQERSESGTPQRTLRDSIQPGSKRENNALPPAAEGGRDADGTQAGQQRDNGRTARATL